MRDETPSAKALRHTHTLLSSVPFVNVAAHLARHLVALHRHNQARQALRAKELSFDFSSPEGQVLHHRFSEAKGIAEKAGRRFFVTCVGNLIGREIGHVGHTLAPRHPVGGMALIVLDFGIRSISGLLPAERMFAAVKEKWENHPFRSSVAARSELQTLGLSGRSPLQER